MPRFEGGCHCGNLAYVFEASAGLDVLGLRACMCRFCRVHGARNTSDPNGSVRIVVRAPAKLIRYRFGLKTADFLICASCGAYIGAHLPDSGGGWITINVNTFVEPPPLDYPLQPHEFGAEDMAGRIARRKERWTPVASFGV
ncbi:MAG TPA: hypothetical protein VL286_05360 [Rhizomicrobium sp.]|nr:hypothetical protein [Rhizomicrobium sp.]